MYFVCSLTPPRNSSRSLSFAQSRQEIHHTLPSFMCILGPNVLNILATRTSTCSCRYRFKTDENQWTLRQCYSENLFVKIKNIWRKKNFPNLFGVSVTHGLGDTFSFIVTRSRSNRIYMTPVLFALRMLLHETRLSWWHRKSRHSKALQKKGRARHHLEKSRNLFEREICFGETFSSMLLMHLL